MADTAIDDPKPSSPKETLPKSKKPFVKPWLTRHQPLKNITMQSPPGFTATGNRSSFTFF